MLDFHMHVLPGIDDGSQDVETSLEMLRRTGADNIDTVAATPHFYAEENSPKTFLARRAAAYERLMSAAEAQPDFEAMPRIRLGAEVRYFGGMSHTEELDSLCLSGTELLLLEMPFVPWNERMLRDVEDIGRRGIQVVAAHIERYMDIQSRKIMGRFMDMGLLIQTNASFFLNRRTGRKALRMLAEGRIHFLGSDSHNVTTRPPDLGPALDLIEAKLGGRAFGHLARFEALAEEREAIFYE